MLTAPTLLIAPQVKRSEAEEHWDGGLPEGGWFVYSKQVEAVLATCESADEFQKMVEDETPNQKTVMAWQIAAAMLNPRSPRSKA